MPAKTLAAAALSLLACFSARAGTYSTTFSAEENPISQGGVWRNGAKDGVDWADVQTRAGLAFGTVVSGGPPYTDPTAVLSGEWAPPQTACATVRTVNQQGGSVYEEVELRLRSTISAHSITGYEFNWRATSGGSQYAQIVRWNGPLNKFTQLAAAPSPSGLHDGDTICARAVGSLLLQYQNGRLINRAVDDVFPGGAPGIGMYMQGGTAAQLADYGLTSFWATDSSRDLGKPPAMPALDSAAAASGIGRRFDDDHEASQQARAPRLFLVARPAPVQAGLARKSCRATVPRGPAFVQRRARSCRDRWRGRHGYGACLQRRH